MSILTNPDLFHGKGKTSNYFEGWYFKLCTKNNSRSIAFIPGISLAGNPSSNHSFIQILDGNNKTFNYIRYPEKSFTYNSKAFKIGIDKNFFSLSNLTLNINEDNIKIKSKLSFKNIFKWKDSIINPGSMGFYNYIPFMECYSQVCSLNGDIEGSLVINNELIDFNGGKVYIEKNWGSSFPLEWIWVQCNSFTNKDVSLTCSIGRVPLLNTSFQGFLIGVTVDNKLYKFTTINRSKIIISLDKGIFIITTHNDIRLTFKTTSNKSDFILCYGPKNGVMSPSVKESIVSKVYMKLENIRTSEVIYEGSGINTGIEYGGEFMNKNTAV